ncbi:radical sam [Trichococcus palustris]|jgi:23S rRNA (adenine2503-C2)-methyltransferase|uniref:Probable dual-specificity RNA methyltransferase RlmN n=1 Tax=Trichococcus palustris TaxID=140314 RepID=A0A143YGJ5_9LACT|nr:23S rRNA (adenine(2503)-C(2))-methyltransferase RlmN [Trichococcus palustris]CZQ90241.1 radical sam [Trichococcus palustris]SFK99433.1 23S rRNA (adenine2503-C2)-methyltransferase [Trichococcus palustris]
MNTASIYGLTLDDLQEWLLLHGQKKFRAPQIWDWLYVKRVQEFADMTNLSKELIASLEANFVLEPLNQVVVQESADGTTKYLFQLADKLMIETVLMYHEYGLSVCVTTQVGCDIGCTFCASGLKRKQRDLTAGEIVAQVMQVQHYLDEKGKGERVSHVVVMGIGEPFDNYDNVMNFLHIINNAKGLAIGARHITVSTSGLAPKIREFADNGLQVNLALSLHAPNDEIRSRMMRINRKHPLEEVMAAIDEYLKKTNRRITFEYIMISGVNDSPEQARELVALLKDKRHLSYVNLIPYNPVAEHIKYERSTQKAMQAFYDILQKNKINCVIRKEHGTDIDAACGQLRSKHLDK